MNDNKSTDTNANASAGAVGFISIAVLAYLWIFYAVPIVFVAFALICFYGAHDSKRWLRAVSGAFTLAYLFALLVGLPPFNIGLLPSAYFQDLYHALAHGFWKGMAPQPMEFIDWMRLVALRSFCFGTVLFFAYAGWREWQASEKEKDGVSDSVNNGGFIRILEGIKKGFLTLTLPGLLVLIIARYLLLEKLSPSLRKIWLGVFSIFILIAGLLFSGAGFIFLFPLTIGSIGALMSGFGGDEDISPVKAVFLITLSVAGIVFAIFGSSSLTDSVGTAAVFLFALGPIWMLENCLEDVFFGSSADEEGTTNQTTIQIGKDQGGKPVLISLPQLNHHLEIVGASGFGKTNLMMQILFQTMAQGRGLLFLDLKAESEMLEAIKAQAKKTNRLNALKIFSIARPDISIPYNLFRHGDASELKDKIMGALEWSEVFYRKEAESFLLKIMRALVYLRDEQDFSFHLGDVEECLTDSKVLILLAGQLPAEEDEIKEDLLELARELENPTKYEKIQGLRSDIQTLTKSEFGNLLKSSEPGLDLFESMQRGDIVYLMLDARRYGHTAERLGRMILQDISTNSGKRGEISTAERPLFTVMIDEFAPLVNDSFVRLLQQARSSNLGIVIAHQELADLRKLSEATQNQILQNTSTTIAFLQKLPDSAEILSGMIGTKKAKELTRQRKDHTMMFESPYTGIASERVVEQFKVHPNTFKSLPRGKCILISKYPTDTYASVSVNKTEIPVAEITGEDEAQINIGLADDRSPLNLRSRAIAYRAEIARAQNNKLPIPPTKPNPGSSGEGSWFS